MDQIAQVAAGDQSTLLHWILNQGPWAFFTAVFMLFLYFGGRAAFTHVVIPLKDHAIEHLKGVASALHNLGETLSGIQDRLAHVDEKTTAIMDEYRGFVDESKNDREIIHERLTQVQERQASLESKIDRLPKVMP